ncbi:hypothetical protein LCGC14_0821450 [marine sediment metagenome]|uniref:Uncharacterized protein n=1 Tax=marine sediment metagenome TaxID=412755 RepID=A0A0F9PIL7_9ZZZZ
MTMPPLSPTADAVVRKAEEEAHVEAELEQAREQEGYREPVPVEQLREEMKSEGVKLGGVTSSAEMLTIYNRYDGVPSQITTDQARQRLSVRFDPSHPWAGQLVWTTKPVEGREMGTLLCPLNPDSAERGYLDGLRFNAIICRKHNMKTAYDVDMHFEHKHKTIFKAVEKDKDRQMKEQQMALMREQTAAMNRMAAAQGDNGQAPEPAAAPVPTAVAPSREPCGLVGDDLLACPFVPPEEKDYELSMQAHRRHQHQGVTA